MTTTVIGIYPDAAAARRAVQRLEAEGFPTAGISMVMRQTPHHEELVRHETEDTHRGILAGILAGGAFASLLVGVVSLAGAPLLAAGPLLAALTAGGAGAAAGGLVGALVGHDLSAHTAQEYETEIQNGKVLIAVHTVHAQAGKARKTLAASGATMISDSVRLGTES